MAFFSNDGDSELAAPIRARPGVVPGPRLGRIVTGVGILRNVGSSDQPGAQCQLETGSPRDELRVLHIVCTHSSLRKARNAHPSFASKAKWSASERFGGGVFGNW